MPAARKPPNEIARLQALLQCRVLDTEPQSAFDDLTRLAAQLCNAPIAAVSLVDAERQWFKSVCGLQIRETHRDLAFCGHAILGSDPLIIRDAAEDHRTRDNALVTGEPGIRFYAGVPLVTDGGFALGTLCVIDTTPRDISPAQLEQLTALARQATSQLELRRKAQQLAETGEALRSARDRLNLAIEAAPNGMLIADRDGQIVYANQQTEALFGYDRADLIGQTVELLVPERHRARHPEQRAEFLRNPTTRAMGARRDLSGRRKDGSEFPIEIGLNPMATPDGICVLASIVDITERKRAENELRRRGLEAKLLQRSAAMAVESISVDECLERAINLVCEFTSWPVGHVYRVTESEPPCAEPTNIWYIDDAQRFAEFRECSDRMTFARGVGLPGRVLQSGRPAWIEDCGKDDNFPRAQQCRDAAVRGAFGFPITVNGLVAAILEFFHFEPIARDESIVALMEALSGQIGRVLERKKAEQALAGHAEQLSVLNQKLGIRNQELDEFTYVASHDLQEPLRKLISFSDLLRMDLGGDLPERAAKDLSYITDAARRMQALVKDLLALSRSGRSAMKRERVSLGSCAEQAILALAERIERAGAEVERTELPDVVGDATLITQLYQNLIGNAIKYAHPERKPVIRLTAEGGEGGWVFGVMDNGIGIKPEYGLQIFAPFKRLHGRGEYEGSGIGLAICRKVAERHGGKIWVESEPGLGSHFRFTIGDRKEDNECPNELLEAQSSC